MILLVWLIPLVLGLLAFRRVANGTPPLKREEWRLLFGKSKPTTLSLWLGLEFAALAIGFFLLGFVQAVILPNLGTFWFFVAPLFTGGGAAFLLVLWLRLGSSSHRARQKNSQPRGRIAEMFFR
jgi:bacteriorhodopsin